MVRLETIIVTVKVLFTVAVIFWLGYSFSGKWMCTDSKWSLYSSFLTISIGLNMSLLLRRTRAGMAERFRQYALKRLVKFSINNGKGTLNEESVNFLGMYYQVLSDRFAKVTRVPGLILTIFGLFASILIVVLFILGIPECCERFIVLLSLPGLLYYLFLAHVYFDVIVQMDGVCIDIQNHNDIIIYGNTPLPEVKSVAVTIGLNP